MMRLEHWRTWWKKEMIVSLLVFTFLVLLLAFVRFSIESAPFLPLVAVFFASFVVVFTIAFFIGRKTHPD